MTGARLPIGPTYTVESLGPREQRVFWLILRGYGMAEIARVIYRSVKTASSHRTHINQKLGLDYPPHCCSNHLLFEYAAKHGLISYSLTDESARSPSRVLAGAPAAQVFSGRQA